MVEPPRITIVTKRLDVGGTETHLLRIAPELKARGIDLDLFVLERDGKLEPAFERRGIVVSGLKRGIGGRISNLARAAVTLALHVRERRAHAVHYFLPEPYLLGGIVSQLSGTPLRLMSRRSLADYQQRHRFAGRLERKLHRRTSVLLANSRAVADELIAECRCSEKVGLIYNGVERSVVNSPALRVQMRHELDVDESAWVITIVANLISYKGHEDLLRGLAIAAPRLPDGWRLLVVGRDDGIGAKLRGLSEQLHIAGNVKWLGLRSDADRILCASDAAVLASHEEGFSNSLIEAMACGLPVIATAVGGNVDAVVDGVTGFLVPSRDPAAMAARIADLAADAVTARAMGARGQERVDLHFTLTKCTSSYENLYRNLDKIGRLPLQSIIDGVCQEASPDVEAHRKK